MARSSAKFTNSKATDRLAPAPLPPGTCTALPGLLTLAADLEARAAMLRGLAETHTTPATA